MEQFCQNLIGFNIPTNVFLAFVYAFLGGFFLKALDWLEIDNLPRDKRPTINARYIASCIVLPLIGAFLAVAYTTSGSTLNSIAAINIGASAPLTLRALASAQFSPSTGDGTNIN